MRVILYGVSRDYMEKYLRIIELYYACMHADLQRLWSKSLVLSASKLPRRRTPRGWCRRMKQEDGRHAWYYWMHALLMEELPCGMPRLVQLVTIMIQLLFFKQCRSRTCEFGIVSFVCRVILIISMFCKYLICLLACKWRCSSLQLHGWWSGIYHVVISRLRHLLFVVTFVKIIANHQSQLA
jgi:hypothetical protein